MDAQGNVHYEEKSTWYDYPSIVYREDYSGVDNLGQYLYHEGEVRAKIDQLLEEAKKLGVLYSVQDSNGDWYVNRVFCFNPASWHFDETLLSADSTTNRMPMGLDLVKAVLEQNGKKLGEVSKTVELLNGGLMNKHHSTEEWAWYYAKRVLYAHRPMLAEVRETVTMFRAWAVDIEKYNEDVEKQMNAAKMIRIMQGNVMKTDASGLWKLDGTAVANLSDSGLKMLSMKSPREANLVKGGFTLYFLYKKLNGIDLTRALNKAKAAIDSWEGDGPLAESMEKADKMLTEETARLEDLDGIPGGEVTQAFQDRLKELRIDSKEAEAMLAFYANAQHWDQV